MAENELVLTISALNRRARETLEQAFPLAWVAGEVSNLTRAPSGHIYFTLKDDAAQARCVMFRSRAQSVPWRLENGQQVEARALVSLYEARGDFQLNIESLRRAGLGALFEAFARLKDKLAAAGLFAAERKQALPRFPRRIGIISSPKAAALQDVLAALARRAPHLPVILYPTPVQGNGAAEKIAGALNLAIEHGYADVLLMVRGGGSIEDLWAFNEEVLAHAIAQCPIPVISGVGHETDVTIADLVADVRAATPTAAAELATQGWHETADRLDALADDLRLAMERQLRARQQQLDQLALRLVHPATRLQQSGDRLRMLNLRLNAAMNGNLRRHGEHLNRIASRLARASPRTEQRRGSLLLLAQRLKSALATNHQQQRHKVDSLALALEHLNPQAILDRGFAVVLDQAGRVVTDAGLLKTGQALDVRLARGQVQTSVVAIAPQSNPD